MIRKKNEPPHAKKRPYRPPELTTHGDLKALTMGKGANQTDSGGMPKTRTSGGA